MPPFVIGEQMTADEARAVLSNIVPPDIRQRMRFKEPVMLLALQQYMPNWVEHEVNRTRGLSFTSNVDAGFTHRREA